MKLEHPMESSESTEDKERRNRDCKDLMDGLYSDMELDSGKEARARVLDLEATRWDNLIYVDMQFYINDFLFKEEFLWDRKIKSGSIIKQFCVLLVREKIFKENRPELCEGVNHFTIDFLELCSEYMTRRISEDVKFYDRVNPYKKLKLGLFGSGCGIEGRKEEHVILINLDLSSGNVRFKDNFEWDIVNEQNNPEDFAQRIVQDMQLNREFEHLIAMSIRKQIKEYVFNLINKFTQTFVNMKEKEKERDERRALSLSALPITGRKRNALVNTAAGVSTRGTIFATYNATSLTALPISAVQSKLDSFKSYQSSIEDPFPKLNDKMTKPVPNLFDSQLEHTLGRKTYRNNPSVQKPQFLNNKLLPSSNLNVKVNTYSKDTLKNKQAAKIRIPLDKEKVDSTSKILSKMLSTKLSTKHSTKHSTKSKRRPLPHRESIRESICSKSSSIKIGMENDFNISSNVNSHVLDGKENMIVISKNIFAYADYYERIIIEKKLIAQFLTDLEMFNENKEIEVIKGIEEIKEIEEFSEIKEIEEIKENNIDKNEEENPEENLNKQTEE